MIRTIFTPDPDGPYDDRDWNLETGEPCLGFFSRAVQCWAWLQDRKTTINEAALAFNVTPAQVRAAVDDHPWMFVGADAAIEHDGE